MLLSVGMRLSLIKLFKQAPSYQLAGRTTSPDDHPSELAQGQSFSQPVWPSGKAEGPRFESASVLLSLQELWSVDTVL